MDFIDLLLECLGVYAALWATIYILGLGIIATLFLLLHFKEI